MYVLDFKESSFLFSFTESKNGIYSFFKTFFIRENKDVFRLSLDFFFLTFIFFFLKKWIKYRAYSLFLYSFFIITFTFQTYQSSFWHIYATEPLLFNDVNALKTGFLIVYQGLSLQVIIYGLLLLIILFLLYLLIRLKLKLIEKGNINSFSKLIFASIFILFIFNLKYRLHQTLNNTLQIQSLFVMSNVTGSLEAYDKMNSIDINKLISSNNYNGVQQTTKPNIIFIAFESYGKVLIDNPEFRPSFIQKLEECNEQLTSNNWYSASSFSKAPVHGGISWVSYSTLAYGFNVENHATYLSLLKNENLKNYHHLFRTLKLSGYKNYRLVSIPTVGKIKIPWDSYTKFYEVDEWILHDNLKYTGKLYGFGPAPSDQYAINFTLDKIKKERQEEPFSLFFITQNTHNPFIAPQKVSRDWRSINDGSRQEITSPNFLGIPKNSNYSHSINYELEVLTKTIIEQGDSNDIFIIVGDHQPPFIAKEKDGMEVPLHLISKNKSFINGFKKYNMKQSLVLTQDHITLKHEGFYSMFMRELIKTYSLTNQKSPNYLENGVEF